MGTLATIGVCGGGVAVSSSSNVVVVLLWRDLQDEAPFTMLCPCYGSASPASRKMF